jgi:hypothetical protein
MERKYTVLILILAGVLALMILLLVLFQYGFFSGAKIPVIQPEKTPVANEQAGEEKAVIDFEEPAAAPAPSAPAVKEITKDDLMRIASSFSERFGSYSNQSNFSNINDLRIFMTANMQNWADKFIADQRAQDKDTSIYYGIITKSVTGELMDFDDDQGKAVILVKTRRREAISSTNNTTNVFDQNITVYFIKENGAWKIDNAVWQSQK